MLKKAIAIFLVTAIVMTLLIQPVSAAYQPELPSIYQTFNDYFMFGAFHSMAAFQEQCRCKESVAASLQQLVPCQ